MIKTPADLPAESHAGKGGAEKSEGRRDRVLGVSPGEGPDQYGGSFGGGQSGGGPYASPHGTEADAADGAPDGGAEHGYYGGGQAGSENSSSNDHHAASRRGSPSDGAATYRDHPSQKSGKARADFDASLARGARDRDLEGDD